MRTKSFVLGLAFVATAGLGYLAGAAKQTAVMWTPADEKWEPLAKDSPLQKVALWGDRDKGKDYGMLLKLPAGGQAGMHAHTGDYYAVAIQGTWVHTFEGGESKELTPGGFVFQPGKAMHDDACKAGGPDCIIFIHQHAKGDFIPGKKAAEAPKPAPAPAAPATK